MKPFTVQYTNSFDVELEPTTAEWLWKISVNSPTPIIVGYYAITNDTNFRTLLQEEPDNAWWTKLNQLIEMGGGEPGQDGAPGTPGKDGSLVTLTAGEITKLPPGSEPTVSVTGTPTVKRLNVGVVTGDKGLDGSNVLPTNDAVAQAINTDGPTKTALSATIGDSLTGVNDIHRAIEKLNMPIMQNTRSELARLRNKDQSAARVVRLVTGNSGQTPAAFGGMTAVHVANHEGRSAWKIATTSGVVNRLDVPLDLHPGPVNAVTAWVYITDPTITTRVQIVATGPAGTWIQYHDASRTNLTGKPLKKGWNFLRMDAAGITSYARLQDVTNISVRFTVSGVTTNYVGPVDLEVREKATILIVNDWGSKAFYDAAYPDMKARGWPVIWAPRTERFGEATYPDNMTTLEEVKTLMAENNNEVSYHSPDGSATSGLTPAQARENVLKALVGLKVHGVYTDGALWRAAWVQNVAPGAAATRDLMVASATPNDRYHTTPWPALDRYDIPRYGIHGGGTDTILELLRQTKQVCVFYTHAVTPTGSSNHASQAQWDAFVTAVDAGIAAGWLEVLNMGQTLERYPLIRTGNEPVTLVDATTPLTPPEPEPEVQPVVTTLVSGLNDTTPTTFAGLTVTHVADVDGRPAWKLTSTDTGACRLDVPVSPAATASNPQTVVFNVHVANPAPFTQITINIRGSAGTWTRTTDQTVISGWPLVAGWNEIRIAATAAPLANLAGVASVNVAFAKTGAQTLHVGSVTIESPGT